jgi:hypothetical protein
MTALQWIAERILAPNQLGDELGDLLLTSSVQLLPDQ